MKMAFSGDSLMRLRITYTNWPTVRSEGTRYFFLSIVAMSLFSTFSQMTYDGVSVEKPRAIESK